ncbi:MAG: hypothetical protein ACPH5P_04140 [Akkermansiaceae bacterium]
MKSCLSFLLAVIIFIAFAGTAGLLWYGSKTTEFTNATQTETEDQ